MPCNHLREDVSRKVGAEGRGWALGWFLGYGTGVTRQVWWPSQGTENPKPKASSFISLPPLSHPLVYTRYGKCYTFNADPQTSLPSRAGGMGSGLEIMLDIQQEEYLPIWRETSTQAGEGQGLPPGSPACLGCISKDPISTVQTRRRLKLASECRSTARRSHPTSTSLALVCPQAFRPSCPARNSG